MPVNAAIAGLSSVGGYLTQTQNKAEMVTVASTGDMNTHITILEFVLQDSPALHR